MNKKRYHEIKDMRRGVPLHSAQRFLAPYVGVGYRIHPFNRNAIISSVQRNVFLGRDKDRKFRTAFEISYTLLTALDCENPELLESILEIMSHDHLHAQVTLNYIRLPEWDGIRTTGSSYEKFLRMLQYYGALFEGSYRCISSIFSLSKRFFNKDEMPTDLQAFVQEKTTRHYQTLMSDKGVAIPELPELCEGYNNHLRNGISHNRWKMLGRKKIEVWDINDKNKVVWKQKYTLDTLKGDIETLARTIDAMDLAILVHINASCNRHDGVAAIPEGFYADEVVEDFIQDVTMDFGLFADSFIFDEETETLTVQIYVPQNLDSPQETKIYEGFEDGTHPNVFTMKKYVHEEKVNNSVLNSLLVIGRCLLQYSAVTLKFTADTSTWTGEKWIAHETDLGAYRFTRAELEAFSKGEHGTIESALAPLADHTLKITTNGLSVPVFP